MITIRETDCLYADTHMECVLVVDKEKLPEVPTGDVTIITENGTELEGCVIDSTEGVSDWTVRVSI